MRIRLQTKQARAAYKIARELVELIDKKQLDYGPNNISAFGELGVLIRLNDKVERLKTLLHQSGEAPNNEPIEDTWKDVANYAIIAILLRRNKWK